MSSSLAYFTDLHFYCAKITLLSLAELDPFLLNSTSFSSSFPPSLPLHSGEIRRIRQFLSSLEKPAFYVGKQHFCPWNKWSAHSQCSKYFSQACWNIKFKYNVRYHHYFSINYLLFTKNGPNYPNTHTHIFTVAYCCFCFSDWHS